MKRTLVTLIILFFASAHLQAQSSIYETASKDGRFKILTAALKATALDKALSNNADLTVFAPTDEAFGKLPLGTVEDLLKEENKSKLTRILKNHVLTQVKTIQQVVSTPRLTTLANEQLNSSIVDGRVRVNNSNIIVSDLISSNGLVHIIDEILMPVSPQESKAILIQSLISEAIAKGVPQFNNGNFQACESIYFICAKALIDFQEENLTAKTSDYIRETLVRVKQSNNSRSNSWKLRGALDMTLKSLQPEKKISKQSTNNDKIILEAKLPEGFPMPGPVNQIALKEYPQYRAAKVNKANYQSSAFMKLFAHITSNNISMTAPVEMNLDDNAQRVDMSFLYSNKNIGKAGNANESVSVIDLPAQKYISIGMKGKESSAIIKGSIKRLNSWITENNKFQAIGKPRLLGYNSPMVPASKRYWEIQIPVKEAP